MLTIKNLTKYYGLSRGCDNVNLEINPGEIYGFIGPNGAGKSTTIKCIMNMINKTKGNIYFDSNELTNESYLLKNDIGYLPSEVNLYEDLSVIEMIKYSDSFYKEDCMERAIELIKYFDLDKNKKIDALSFGNKKKLGIILAFMHSPKLVILDEASSGLDPLIQEKFYKLLINEKKKGTTIFFSSHILSEVKRICDKVAIIKDGTIIKIDSVNKMIEAETVVVTIYSEEFELIKKKIKNNIIEALNNKVKFLYNKDINKLITLLSNYKIDKLMIEESSIEEVFLHYYE